MSILVFVIRISDVQISKFKKISNASWFSPRGVVYCVHKFFQLISFSLCEQPRLFVPPIVIQSSHGLRRFGAGAGDIGTRY